MELPTTKQTIHRGEFDSNLDPTIGENMNKREWDALVINHPNLFVSSNPGKRYFQWIRVE